MSFDKFNNTQSIKFSVNGTKWDQSSYFGRAKHFFKLTDPRNILASYSELDMAKKIMNRLKNGEKVTQYNNDELWDIKYLYDSAFHPETGEKQFILGRMSAQVPCNMFLTAGLLATYRSTGGLLFFQFLNQSFNAAVNYTNRSGVSQPSKTRLLASYLGATGCAISSALILNRLTSRSSLLIQRLIPFVSVSLGNIINVSIMRSNELMDGIPVYDKNGNITGLSHTTAKIGIGSVIFSRITMSTPGLVLTPALFNLMVSKKIFKPYSVGGLTVQTLLCGFFLIFATPLCCAFLPQKMSIKAEKLEADVYNAASMATQDPSPEVHFNRGL